MAFKLHFALFCYAAYFVYIRDICEHVKLNAAIQLSGLFSIQFCSNHNLGTPL